MANATSQTTTDHKKIQQWVAERGGHPARVIGTEKRNSPGVLRIDYPGFSGEERLETITWDEFFDGFEKNKLAFLYQERTADGKMSRFSKLIERDTAKAH